MTCEHKTTEIRKRRSPGGTVRYLHQCMDCGVRVGMALHPHQIADPSSIKPWTVGLAQKKRGNSKRTYYQRYLNSPRWKGKRAERLEIANFVCERCGDEEDLEVHHLNYERLGEERPDDLIVLCQGCHDGEHGRR